MCLLIGPLHLKQNIIFSLLHSEDNANWLCVSQLDFRSAFAGFVFNIAVLCTTSLSSFNYSKGLITAFTNSLLYLFLSILVYSKSFKPGLAGVSYFSLRWGIKVYLSEIYFKSVLVGNVDVIQNEENVFQLPTIDCFL